MDRYGNPWAKYRVYPLRAVRHKCLDCSCEVAGEVRLCPVEDCSLWPYRFGLYPENYQGRKSVLQSIKDKCADCAPESRDAVKNCLKKCCPIWPYRMGTNPKRKGKGGAPPESARFKKSTGLKSTKSGRTI